MKSLLLLFTIPVLAATAEPALTIYNQNFAVVRDTVPLDLKAGVNEVRFSGMTATAETDSVILRDPSGAVKLRVLEQSYRNDPVSQEFLLSLNEGKTIDFLVRESQKADHTVQGKIIRSGYGAGGQNQTQPIIEVEGQLQFSLPGEPRFPALGDDTILNPTLTWTLDSSERASSMRNSPMSPAAFLARGLQYRRAGEERSHRPGRLGDVRQPKRQDLSRPRRSCSWPGM